MGYYYDDPDTNELKWDSFPPTNKNTIDLTWAEPINLLRLNRSYETLLSRLTISSLLMCNNVYSGSISHEMAELSDEEEGLYSDLFALFGLTDPKDSVVPREQVCSSCGSSFDYGHGVTNLDTNKVYCSSECARDDVGKTAPESIDHQDSEPVHNTDGGKTSLYNIPDWVEDLDDLSEAWELSSAEFNAIKAIKGASLIRQGKSGRHAASIDKPDRDHKKSIHYTRRILKEYNRKNLHLCDSCQFEFSVCTGIPKFGTGFGNDNVYSCRKYKKDD